MSGESAGGDLGWLVWALVADGVAGFIFYAIWGPAQAPPDTGVTQVVTPGGGNRAA